jgi:NAD-dependent deacetylase
MLRAGLIGAALLNRTSGIRKGVLSMRAGVFATFSVEECSMHISEVASLLRSVERIAVLSGAGLSKASGIPTYRDKGGLWTQEGTARFSSVQELERDPQGFCDFWAQRRREIAQAAPNQGHAALAQLQHIKPETTLITQNVDGLLTKAGARDVLEVHGSLSRERCNACGAVREHVLVVATGRNSQCASCSCTLFRPDVVMFGEFLDAKVSAKADHQAKTSQVFILAGTSAVVHPAAGWAEKAQGRGAKLVIVNLEATPFDDVADVVIHGRTEEVLPKILERLRG